MTQRIAIILKFRESETGRFEEMFEAEVLPLWNQFLAANSSRRRSLPLRVGTTSGKGSVSTSCTSKRPEWSTSEPPFSTWLAEPS